MDEIDESNAKVVDGWRYAARSVTAGYFWLFAAVGSFGPFISLYFRDLGFSGIEIGALAAMPAVAAAFAGPIWGSIADSLAAHRFVLRFSLALAVLIALATTQVTAFLAVLVLIGLLSLATSPVASFLDGYAVAVGERLDVSYGRLRVWGSIGYTITVFGVGWMMGEHVDRLFIVVYASCLALTLVTTIGLPRMGERRTRSLFDGIGLLRHNRPLAALLLTSYLVTSSTAVMYGFFGIRIEELGGSTTLLGGAIAIGAASELPVIFAGQWFLRKLGAPRLIAIAIAVYSFRLAYYGVISDPLLVLPVQLLHGLSFGAFLTASVMLVHRLAGREHAATAQALLASASFGFGSITGSLIGGALLDVVGSDWLFRGAAILMFSTLVGFLFVMERLDFDLPEIEPGQT